MAKLDIKSTAIAMIVFTFLLLEFPTGRVGAVF